MSVQVSERGQEHGGAGVCVCGGGVGAFSSTGQVRVCVRVRACVSECASECVSD